MASMMGVSTSGSGGGPLPDYALRLVLYVSPFVLLLVAQQISVWLALVLLLAQTVWLWRNFDHTAEDFIFFINLMKKTPSIIYIEKIPSSKGDRKYKFSRYDDMIMIEDRKYLFNRTSFALFPFIAFWYSVFICMRIFLPDFYHEIMANDNISVIVINNFINDYLTIKDRTNEHTCFFTENEEINKNLLRELMNYNLYKDLYNCETLLENNYIYFTLFFLSLFFIFLISFLFKNINLKFLKDRYFNFYGVALTIFFNIPLSLIILLVLFILNSGAYGVGSHFSVFTYILVIMFGLGLCFLFSTIQRFLCFLWFLINFVSRMIARP